MSKPQDNQPQDKGYEPDLIVLTDEEGQECTFEVVDTLEHNALRYMAMVPYVEDEAELDEDQELILMRVCQDADGEFLSVVDEEKELEEIGGLFAKRLAEDFDIEL